jgi:hypothetical protein
VENFFCAPQSLVVAQQPQKLIGLPTPLVDPIKPSLHRRDTALLAL